MPGNRSLAVVVLLSVPALGLAGASQTYRDVTIIAEDGPKGSAEHGYAEYRVTIQNRSTTAAHRVTLSLPRHDYAGYAMAHLRVTRTADVGPDSTVLVSFFAPVFPPVSGGALGVTIDGRTFEEAIPLHVSTSLPRHGPSTMMYAPRRRGMTAYSASPATKFPLVLLGPLVPADFSEKAVPSSAGGKTGAAAGLMPPAKRGKSKAPEPAISGEPEFVKGEAATTWSTSWLGYSRYDGVVVTSRDLEIIPPAARVALFQYAECGGVLLVLGKTKLPPNLVKRPEQFGLRVYESGLGEVLVQESGRYDRWREQWPFLWDTFWETSRPFLNPLNVVEAHRQFPVVLDIAVPVKGLFGVIVTFVIVIGPVNLALLTRLRRRMWMLWTVPVISFATCAAVFGYMIVAEGWQGHLRTEALTVLDESTHRATSLGWTGFYSPLSPSGGLHFSPDTELTVYARGDQETTAAGGDYGSDWTVDQHLLQGWVSPRVPAFFLVRKSEVRRERVVLHRSASGRRSIVNGLGTRIVQIWYKDERGGIFSAANVAAGAEAILEPAELPAPPTQPGGAAAPPPARHGAFRQLYLGSWLKSARDLAENPAGILRPQTYVAALEDSPFIEDGLQGAGSRKCASVVIGVNKEIDAE